MRRALVLAYHFPPVGGAGVKRNAKFVRYLRDYGYEPVVVTGPGASADRWAPTDDTLAADIPADVEVHRISSTEPAPSSRLRSRLERWLGIRSPRLKWLLSGLVDLGVHAGVGCDIVYASLVPYEIASAANIVARQLEVAWVADLQDPWALDEMMVYLSRLHRRPPLPANAQSRARRPSLHRSGEDVRVHGIGETDPCRGANGGRARLPHRGRQRVPVRPAGRRRDEADHP